MEFRDVEGNQVILKKDEPVHHHVLIIPFVEGDYLLTHHKERGIEFPGGKREAGESAVEAAHRELFEETGATGELKYITSYTVMTDPPFTKDVFKAVIDHISPQTHYHETAGPIIVSNLDDIDESEQSRLLKDACIQYIVREMIACGSAKQE
ncbi:NUDIX domain-containing protein [Macrococcus hajekii]|uniref:NUDIX domain-containing protein n=1 Tax=Macrococcus hajekii TaxID=198482 RepID=A0A4R6BLE2_9STAP|nr:NUDIX domain-containing protein [Macrococcus hajekii]TDM02603.1 NUDIX domain-containing protein [Macrococcus hajekii]GGB02371.1 nucleoside triphosphatase YtkD [Macrococcus hajekii]